MRVLKIYKGFGEALRLTVVLLVLAFVLAYVHYGYKEVALTLAMWGFPYADTENARTFLQEIGQTVTADVGDDREKVEAFITWTQENMRLRGGLPNHPNPVYLIENGGVCGQFADVLVDLLRANGFEARQVLLNWQGQGAAHTITEVKTNGNGWPSTRWASEGAHFLARSSSPMYGRMERASAY